MNITTRAPSISPIETIPTDHASLEAVFDFILDVETFAFFNYQYILYGMEFPTDLSAGRSDFPNVAAARKLFDRIRVFGEKAARDLPSHRDLVSELAAA